MALEKVAHNHISPLCFSRPYAFGLMSWHWSGRISDEVFKSLFRYDPTPAETKVRTRFCDKYYEFASIQSQGQDSTPAIGMRTDWDPTRHPGPQEERPAHRVTGVSERKKEPRVPCSLGSKRKSKPNFKPRKQKARVDSERHHITFLAFRRCLRSLYNPKLPYFSKTLIPGTLDSKNLRYF